MDTHHIELPHHLPAACFMEAAKDYEVPHMLLVAIVKHESNGRSVVSSNPGGTRDIGVAQLNSGSWVPYMWSRYGIKPTDLMNPCQSIRAAGYILRYEMNTKACANKDIWCAVGRYHSPGNSALAARYIQKIWTTWSSILGRGSF